MSSGWRRSPFDEQGGPLRPRGAPLGPARHHPRPQPGLRVSYGWDEVPGEGEAVAGSTAKLQRLATRFPNRPADYTLLYLASNCLPPDLRPQLAIARQRHAPVVVNQDGVGYPGWAGERTEEVNRPLRRLLAAADHVLYQSAFCEGVRRPLPRRAARRVGDPPQRGRRRALHARLRRRPPAAPTLLLGGDQTQAYRLEIALRTLAALRRTQPDARLGVTGRLVSDPEALVASSGSGEAVELVGPYAQRDAPASTRRAHVLLHPKVNDPCPSVVLEAMACGVPVVYAASGGTVELVGEEAGIGVAHPGRLGARRPAGSRRRSPRPSSACSRRASAYAAAARQRAVERFALEPWLDRHEALFAQLLGARR